MLWRRQCKAAEQDDRAAVERRRAVERQLEEAEYEASLAARRNELVDPAKRHVARELEARWNTALERVEQIAQCLVGLDSERGSRPAIDRAALMDLVHGVVTMEPRLAKEISVLVLIQRDRRSGHWTPPLGRHQTECGRIPIVANASVPMAELSASSWRGGARRCNIGVRERSDDGKSRVDRVFQPSSGRMTQASQSPNNSERFSSGPRYGFRQGTSRPWIGCR